MVFRYLLIILVCICVTWYDVICSFLGNGDKITADKTILTAGTFLRGEICIGLDVRPAGRVGAEPAIGLAKTIEDIGFTIGRLRTGS